MIKDIDARLCRWADWAATGKRVVGLGYARCTLATWTPSSGASIQSPEFNLEASETDTALRLLPSELIEIIVVYYLKKGTQHQKARDCRVSVKTLYNRLDHAHQRLQQIILDKANKIKARESMNHQRLNNSSYID